MIAIRDFLQDSFIAVVSLIRPTTSDLILAGALSAPNVLSILAAVRDWGARPPLARSDHGRKC